MIIEPNEILSLERQLRLHLRREEAPDTYDNRSFEFPGTVYLHRHPHLLLAAGFDEYRVLRETLETRNALIDMFPRQRNMLFPLQREAILRASSSGAWHLFQGLQLSPNTTKPALEFVFEEGFRPTYYPAERLLAELKKIAATPLERTSVLAFGSLWAESHARAGEIQIIDTTRGIIEAIRGGRQSLQDIGWRDLEELIAEMLRNQGMAISVTPRTNDGGRDILARGELFGEPLTIAVEVKQKRIVPVSDARAALYANRHLPVLMLATSGSFSAGVIKEKAREENRLRLLLKDGIALSQWIRSYRHT